MECYYRIGDRIQIGDGPMIGSVFRNAKGTIGKITPNEDVTHFRIEVSIEGRDGPCWFNSRGNKSRNKITITNRMVISRKMNKLIIR